MAKCEHIWQSENGTTRCHYCGIRYLDWKTWEDLKAAKTKDFSSR